MSTGRMDEALSPAQERMLVRKVDALLMPLLTISYGLQFYDKFVFSSAAVFGMLADLQLEEPVPGTKLMNTQRYSTATAAFYWGYLVGVIPIALLLRRLPLARTLAAFVFAWGVLAMATAGLSSFSGTIALRFFLGIFESAVSPGFVLVTAAWYKPAELPVRLGIWYSATGLFTIFAGLLNFAIGHVHGALAPWKYMYIVAGALTIGWAMLLALLLPDSHSRAPGWLFSPTERAALARRLDSGALRTHGIEWTQLAEAARDPQVWLLALMGAAVYVCNGGVTAFGSLIIKSFGYSSLRAIVLQAPGGATTCIAIYVTTWLAGRFRNTHTLLLALSCVPVLTGALLLWTGPAYVHARGRALAGYYLLPTFGAPYVLLLSLLAANVRGRTKRAAGAGALFVGYCVGNIVGPYLVNTSEAPVKYRTTWTAVVVCMAFTIAAAGALRILLVRENARRDAGAAPHDDQHAVEKGDVHDGEQTEAGVGVEKTDREDLAFRYTL